MSGRDEDDVEYAEQWSASAAFDERHLCGQIAEADRVAAMARNVAERAMFLDRLRERALSGVRSTLEESRALLDEHERLLAEWLALEGQS